MSFGVKLKNKKHQVRQEKVELTSNKRLKFNFFFFIKEIFLR